MRAREERHLSDVRILVMSITHVQLHIEADVGIVGRLRLQCMRRLLLCALLPFTGCERAGDVSRLTQLRSTYLHMSSDGVAQL